MPCRQAPKRCAPAIHATLARLHDLGALDDQGIALDLAVAREAVDESARWLTRLEEMLAG